MKIIFVYNASTAFFSQVTDFAHKIISPDTYECNLCKLTYGNFSIKKDWQEFIAKLPHTLIFWHKEELLKEIPAMASTSLPVILTGNDRETAPRILISSEELNKLQTLEELKTLLLARLR